MRVCMPAEQNTLRQAQRGSEQSDVFVLPVIAAAASVPMDVHVRPSGWLAVWPSAGEFFIYMLTVTDD